MKEILEHQGRSEWITQSPGETQRKELDRAFADQGVEVFSVDTSRRTLEDKFLETVQSAREDGQETEGAEFGGQLPAFLSGPEESS